MHAGLAAALGFNIGLSALHLVHVRSRSTDIADRTLELFILGQFFDLADNARFASRLNRAALMSGDRTKCATRFRRQTARSALPKTGAPAAASGKTTPPAWLAAWQTRGDTPPNA